MFKFGCCVGLADLPNVLNAGFDFAELQVRETIPLAPEDEWVVSRQKIEDAGVPIRGFNVLLPAGMKVVGPDVDVHALHSYVDVAFARMRELGGEHLSFGSGGARYIPEDFDRNKAISQLQTFVSYLGHLGQKYNITVNIEFLNRKETNVILSLLEAQEYVKVAGLSSVKLLADLYHIMEEQEPLDDLRQVSNDIGYVHLADTGRLYPGSGSYPHKEMADILREVGYKGPISVECKWNDMDVEMPKAATFIRKIFTD